MTTLPAWLLPALGGAMVTLLIAIFGYLNRLSVSLAKVQKGHEDMCKAHQACLDKVPVLEKALDRLTFRQEMSDEIVVKEGTAAVHSPTHIERDALLDKLSDKTITRPELAELRWRLELMGSDEPDPVKRLWAAMLLIRVRTMLGREHEAAQEQTRTTEGACQT
jgi:hypothetical protein